MNNNHCSPPFLSQPILHISHLPPQVPDQDIIAVFHECLRARLNIQRTDDQLQGTVEFEKLENAEKAYATLHNCYLSQYDSYLRLSHSADPAADPKPSARVRLIKFLPPHVTPGRLFSIFRPFGPIYRVTLNYHHTPDGLPFFSGTAVIEFYTESQASLAQTEMHCSELDRHTIAVEEYDDRRDRSGRGMALINSSTTTSPQSKWAQAAPFVPLTPSDSLTVHNNRRPSQQSSFSSEGQPPVSKWANAQNQQQPYLLNPNSSSISPTTTTSKWASPQTPHISGHNSPDPSGQPIMSQKQVDPCNLFIKGLSPELESGDLFHAFKQFGTIVSARVMKNETTGVSKQFGFVSFTTEEATANALKAMDGVSLGQSSNRIVVRLHELKKIKEGRPSKLVSPPPITHVLEETSTNRQGPELLLSSGPMQQAVPEPQTPGKKNALEVQTASPMVQEAQLTQTIGGSRLSSALASPSILSACGSPTTSSVSMGPTTERQRMAAAVGRLQEGADEGMMSELLELLMALPTRERKLCLFNPQVLATKVSEAREIIETPDELLPPPKSQPVTASNLALAANPTTETPVRSSAQPGLVAPSSNKAITGSPAHDTSITGSPSSRRSEVAEPEFTSLASLGRLGVTEIVAIMLEQPHRVGPDILPPCSTDAWRTKKKETEVWLDEKIFSLPSIHQQKQKIGEKLFRIVKGFGLKNAPKITVDLLDSHPLRPLALLMTLFPEILKEKIRPSSSSDVPVS